MWNKRSLWLYVRVTMRGARPRLWLILPLALYVPHQLLLAYDGLLALLPGQVGRQARRATDAIHGLLLELIAMPPLTIADVDMRDGAQRIRVKARTCGLPGAIGDKASTRVQNNARDKNCERESGRRHLPPNGGGDA